MLGSLFGLRSFSLGMALSFVPRPWIFGDLSDLAFLAWPVAWFLFGKVQAKGPVWCPFRCLPKRKRYVGTWLSHPPLAGWFGFGGEVCWPYAPVSSCSAGKHGGGSVEPVVWCGAGVGVERCCYCCRHRHSSSGLEDDFSGDRRLFVR